METRGRLGSRSAAPFGFAVGLLLVVAALLAWRVPPGQGTVGAAIVFSSAPTGELTVSPSGPFLTQNDLRPDETAKGQVVLRNQTGSTLAIRVRALPSAPDLDRILRVAVAAGDDRVFEGRLARLRRWSAPFALTAGESRPVRLRAWLAPGTTKGYEGRVESIPVEFDTHVLGGTA